MLEVSLFSIDQHSSYLITKHRIYLGVEDLESHYQGSDVSFEDLLDDAKQLARRYMSVEAYEIALAGGDAAKNFFTNGPRESTKEKLKKEFWGDEILANVILRMRDSMFHYEFQCAVAEGDIGRAMDVMSVRSHYCLDRTDPDRQSHFRCGLTPSLVLANPSTPMNSSSSPATSSSSTRKSCKTRS